VTDIVPDGVPAHHPWQHLVLDLVVRRLPATVDVAHDQRVGVELVQVLGVAASELSQPQSRGLEADVHDGSRGQALASGFSPFCRLL
jgi:hypothetical protein